MNKIKDTFTKINIDASNKVLGKLAVEIANLLRGKTQPAFTYHKDPHVIVIVSNFDKIILTGKKLAQKRYYSYSGYPSGIKKQTVQELLKKDPSRIIKLAVAGMLPKNRLKKIFLSRLKFVKDNNEGN